MKKKRIGVLLAGCGVKDGSEIHEATLTLYFLDKQGAEIVCMAPNKDQTGCGKSPYRRGHFREAQRAG